MHNPQASHDVLKCIDCFRIILCVFQHSIFSTYLEFPQFLKQACVISSSSSTINKKKNADNLGSVCVCTLVPKSDKILFRKECWGKGKKKKIYIYI